MPKWLKKIDPRLKFEILGIILITAGILFIISLIGLNAGAMGIFMAKLLKYSFGYGAVALPLTMVIIGLRYIVFKGKIVYSVKFWGLLLLYFLILTIIHYILIPPGQEIMPDSLPGAGGLSGGLILFSLRKLFGLDGSILVIFALTVCAVLMSSSWSLGQTALFAKRQTINGYNSAKESWEALAATGEPTNKEDKLYFTRRKEEPPPAMFYDQQTESASDIPPVPPTRPVSNLSSEGYALPPLSLLKKAPENFGLFKSPKEISANSRVLEQTLESFGVKAKVIDACQGPTITRYELEPALGVKVSKIVSLADDISLKLAAAGIRIEAPIPGKAAIGIEVPNKQSKGVFLSEVLESHQFKNSPSFLTVALGKDIAGKPVTADLSKMPHLLVAGSTGSGKSVCINTLISSILFKASPSEVRFIMIDPKMVELSNYNGISHLLTPVVTDAKKAASALVWAVNEMERRYVAFATAGVKDIFRYNELNRTDFLPLIVIIIDELADLMMVSPAEVEDSICRLAQKARASGIHLVLATQRPSVNVITGTIKANIPSRISFAVSSQIDSRTILDMGGAEKLLGRGDMLFYPVGAAKPVRLQGAFVSDDEIEDLVLYIKDQYKPPEYTDCSAGGASREETSMSDEKETRQNQIKKTLTDQIQDELLEEAVRVVIETGQVSVSMLQRKFRIGYTRAARLIDTMEKMNIVNSDLRKREIIMALEEANFRYFNK